MAIASKIINLIIKDFPKGGTILEFGVARGVSYTQLAKMIKDNKMTCKLIGFDAWQGLPKETEGVFLPKGWSEGTYCFNRNVVENRLRKIDIVLPDKRFQLVDGWLKDTLTKELQQTIKNLIFVNIDTDLYTSAVTILDFIFPVLQDKTLIYFDDWKTNAKELCGEMLAFRQWKLKNPEIKYEFVVRTHNTSMIRILK